MADRRGTRFRLRRNPGKGWACGNCGTNFHAHDKARRHVAVCDRGERTRQDEEDEEGYSSSDDRDADGECLSTVRGLASHALVPKAVGGLCISALCLMQTRTLSRSKVTHSFVRTRAIFYIVYQQRSISQRRAYEGKVVSSWTQIGLSTT